MAEAEHAFHELSDTCGYRSSFTDCEHVESSGVCGLSRCPILAKLPIAPEVSIGRGDLVRINGFSESVVTFIAELENQEENVR